MCFFRKKKPAQSEVKDLDIKLTLREALAAQPRTENSTVAYGTVTDSKLPAAMLTALDKTLSEDLGPRGRVSIRYDQKRNELCLLLVFSYAEGSEEIKVVENCLEDFDVEDEEGKLPGDVTAWEICYITTAPVTEVSFYAENVERRELREAADRLLGGVFDWLDIVYEAFEEEF